MPAALAHGSCPEALPDAMTCLAAGPAAGADPVVAVVELAVALAAVVALPAPLTHAACAPVRVLAVVAFETLRDRFLGYYGTYANPEALARGTLTNFETAGENMVGVQQADLELEPGETRELIVLLGLGTPDSHGKRTVAEYGNAQRCAAELQRLKQSWHSLLEAVHVLQKTAFSVKSGLAGSYQKRPVAGLQQHQFPGRLIEDLLNCAISFRITGCQLFHPQFC